MRADNTLIRIENCTGFNDVYNHKSAAATVVGLVKIILSCALILPPIVLGCIYLKNKKVSVLQTEIDRKIDAGQLQELFTETVTPQKNQETGQNKMIKYLINKLANFEQTDNEELELSRFEKGFKQLSFESQGEFFKMAHSSNCFEIALKWIPKDIIELNFISGPSNPIRNSDINDHNVTLFLKEFPKFTHLENIELDLQGLGFYSPSVDSNVQTMSFGTNTLVHTQDPTRIFEVRGSDYYHFNDTYPIIKTIAAMKTLIQKQPNLKWLLLFANFGTSGKGPNPHLLINGKMSYVKNLTAYFQNAK